MNNHIVYTFEYPVSEDGNYTKEYNEKITQARREEVKKKIGKLFENIVTNPRPENMPLIARPGLGCQDINCQDVEMRIQEYKTYDPHIRAEVITIGLTIKSDLPLPEL